MSTESTTTTLFVRNIPYSWFDRDLERCFEHIGPIRRAFCVTTRGKKAAQALGDDGAVGSAAAAGGKAVENNRGFGFIEFATHADAIRAVEEMNDKAVEEPSMDDAKKGKSAGPKKLHVELSVKKGEKPVMPKKDEATPATDSNKPKPEKKGLNVKDIKLDAKALEKKKAVTKAVSDSETSESEDEEEEKEKQKAKQKKQEEEKKAAAAAAKAVKKETPAAPVAAPTKPTAKVTPAPASAHTPTTARPTPTTSTSAGADSAAAISSRTVLISGINPTVKNINEHLKGLVSNISQVLFPSPESTLKYKAARLTFATDALADAAVGLLDKKLIKGDPVRCIKLNNESKANRLIIRNLPWLVGEKRLHLIFRDCCAPVEKGGGGGSILTIDLPKEADGKSKGFGFISFSTLAAAELALKKTGTILNNRPIAVDWSLSKDDYQNRVTLNQVEEKKLEAKKIAKEEAKAQAEKENSKSKKVKAEKESDDEDDIKVKKEEDMDVDEDANDVDLAADKRKNKSILSSILGSDDEEDDEEEDKSSKSSKKVKQEDDDDSDVDMKDEFGSDSDDEADEEEDEDEDEEDGSDHDDDELNMSDDSVSDSDASMSDDEDDDDDSLGDEAAPELDQNATPKFTHPRTSDTIKGCTVFIRNLSYDTTEDKLMDKFSQFGECKYAKVCWDKELDRSRGTAFVQFLAPEVAKKVVGMSVDTSNTPAALYKKNKITAAVATGAGITLDGRVLNIAMAVDREQATTLAEKNKEKQKEDKRNLYLANEGNIRPDSEAAKEMPPAELEKREKAFREKKKKLKNPNYCVSRTRLSVRNLPLDADEKVMKRVFLAAARDAVKEQPKNSPLRDGTIGQPVLQQVKLLRATDRLDSKGIGRSKRYGFVEFSHHEHSLLALRALNNNPNAFANAEIAKGKHERPFVEFALEDARKLLIRQQKQAAQEKRKALKAKQQAELDATNGVAPVETKKKPALPKSSEQPRKKPLKAPTDPSAGGGRGACFICGQPGHIGRNCPTKNGGTGGGAGAADDSAAKQPVSNGKQHAGNKRKATDAPSAPAEKEEPAPKKSKPSPSHGAAATPAASSESAGKKDLKGKNKNNKHRDVNLPSHLNDGGKDEAKFEKIVQAHKKKFFGGGESADKIKAAASRWFE